MAGMEYWGYDFDDEQRREAMYGGLAGAVRGMAGAETWADAFTGLASGYHSGMEHSLANSLEMQRRREAEEERERQKMEFEQEKERIRAAAEARSGWALEQIPDELEAGLAPSGAFADPVSRAEYLTGEAGRFAAENMSQAEHQEIQEEILARGGRPTGVPKIDAKLLEGMASPEKPMTAYQRESLDLRRQAISRAAAEEEEDEQEEVDEAYQETDMYRRLRGLPLDPDSPTVQRQEAEERRLSEDKLQAILGDDYTGIPEVDNAVAREEIKRRREAGGAPPETSDPKVAKPAAPGMPRAGEPKPTHSIPSSGPPSTVKVTPNPRDLSDEGLGNLARSIGVPPDRMKMLLSQPGYSTLIRQEWAKANTEAERQAVRQQLAERLRMLGWIP